MLLLQRQNRRGFARTSVAAEVHLLPVAAMLGISQVVACRRLSTINGLKLVWTTCGDYKLVELSDRLVADLGREVV